MGRLRRDIAKSRQAFSGLPRPITDSCQKPRILLKSAKFNDTVNFAMKAVLFLPLAYIVGIDGFAMFAIYVIAVMTLAYLVSQRSRQPKAVVVRIAVRNPAHTTA